MVLPGFFLGLIGSDHAKALMAAVGNVLNQSSQEMALAARHRCFLRTCFLTANIDRQGLEWALSFDLVPRDQSFALVRPDLGSYPYPGHGDPPVNFDAP